MDHPEQARWTNRWTFIFAATGSAVGLGNIWKFPYITGEYGGGAFVLVYLACILGVGVPVMMAEILVGRRGRTDPMDAMKELAEENGVSPRWSIVGAMGIAAGAMILMFYGVVAGWALEYVLQSATGAYADLDAQGIEAGFSDLTSDFNRQWLWQTVFVAATAAVLAAGVTEGIGRAVEILMPLLFLFLLVLLGYSLSVGDAQAGFDFMFNTDFSKLSTEAVLVALGHAFFSLSLGMGVMMAYGAYMPGNASIGKTVLTIALLDTVIALLAGMVIFPLVFANGLEPGAGPGLMFVTLPIAFAEMPGGLLIGTLFFGLVSVAALSSSISMIEPGIALLEARGISRVRAAIMLASICWLGGIASIYSSEVFNLFDETTAKYLLPGGGLLIVLFTGWRLDTRFSKEEFAMGDKPFAVWLFATRFIAPAGILVVFANSLGWI